MKKKICIVTGTRADYGILTPVIAALSRSRCCQPLLVATGMHLMKEFGLTVREIERDDPAPLWKVPTVYRQDTGEAMAGFVGETVRRLAGLFKRLEPDFILVLGDRGEMLAAAIAGDYLNLPVAHIHGGELSGHVDGLVRHAITKLAHLHFTATAGATARVQRLGEESWRVHQVGAPALDTIINADRPDRALLRQKYKLDSDLPLLLIVLHPVITESGRAADQMEAALAAVRSVNAQKIVIYPNADAGGRRMIEVVRNYEKMAGFSAFSSVPHRDYLGLMSVAAALVGNSSSGLIEAPSFKLPVVNIGSRQAGRERGDNIIDVNFNRAAIRQAVDKALTDQVFLNRVKHGQNPYGNGRAGKRIAGVLGRAMPKEKLLNKKMTY